MNDKKPLVSKKTNASVKKFQRSLLILFVGVVLVMDILLTTGISYYSSKTLNEKVSMLMNVNTYQQAMNVESYFSNIKDTASLFFSDAVYYTYDATEEMSDFDRLQSESVILERIRSLGVLENFSDFGIIYADDSSIGWMSEGMFEMLATDEMYDFFASHITDENTESGWFCTDKNNYDRIYYVKRLNKNAVIVASIFSRELESVFNIPDELNGMDMRLVDENKFIIYSTNKDEIGEQLESNIEDLVFKGSSVSNREYIVSSISFKTNEWCIICSMPESFVKEGISKVNLFAHAFSAAMMLIVAILGFISLYRVSNPVSELVLSLSDKAEHDQLTGVLNKISFQTMTESLLKNETEQHTAVFIMLDLDNFKLANDTNGHKHGDEILMRFAKLIQKLYDQQYIIGRLGGDEFAIFTVVGDADINVIKNNVSRGLEVLKNEFVKEFKEDNENCGLSLSSGAYVADIDGLNFDMMYKTSDSALYQSKNTGKNTYTVL